MKKQTIVNRFIDASIRGGVQTQSTFHQLRNRAARLALAVAATACLACAQTPYLIFSAANFGVIGVPNFSTQDHTLLNFEPLNLQANQLWTLRRVSLNNTAWPRGYEIVNVNSQKVIDVPGFSTADFTKIQQFSANGGMNQQWRLSQPAGSVGFEIISIQQKPLDFTNPSNVFLALDAAKVKGLGNSVVQLTENDSLNQQWFFTPIGSGAPAVTAAGAGADITITGSGFQPGTEACPVLNSQLDPPCVTVLPDGTFNTVVSLPPRDRGLSYDSQAPGHIVITIENDAWNVLAITTVPGALIYTIS